LEGGSLTNGDPCSWYNYCVLRPDEYCAAGAAECWESRIYNPQTAGILSVFQHHVQYGHVHASRSNSRSKAVNFAI